MVLGSTILRLSTGLALFAFLFVAVVALVSFRLLTRRLDRLARDMDHFRHEAGRANAAPDRTAAGGDEIDRLSASFDRMAQVIRGQVDTLERTDSLRRELVANVSHDLRTPLSSLHGYLETLGLKADELSESEQREYVAVALRNSERLRKLVTELFELAKLDAREIKPEFETFSIAELVQDVVQDFQLRAGDKGVALEARLCERLPPVRGDIRLIERVLQNLIENALRYTPEGGRVGVHLELEGGRVRVTVEDSGVGIPAEELPYIFERFHRVPRATSEESIGSGLGLAISKRILELHQTMIEASSQLDRGTRFTFHLAQSGASA